MSDISLRSITWSIGAGQLVPLRTQENFQRAPHLSKPAAARAHVEGDKTELAYKRTDYFDKRRALMQAWATYCVNQRPAHAQRKRKAHAGN
jgi:hypothetical protein